MFNYKDKYNKISTKELKKLLISNEKYLILDVRTNQEYISGHIEKAINLPDDKIKKESDIIIDSLDTKVIVYCLTGKRSRQAAKELIRLGYTSIYDLGGIILWPGKLVR